MLKIRITRSLILVITFRWPLTLLLTKEPIKDAAYYEEHFWEKRPDESTGAYIIRRNAVPDYFDSD